jgi:hypothetical protein
MVARALRGFMRHILLAAAVLAATPATAGQYLAPGPGGFSYAPTPRGPWLNGYVRPYRPNPAPFIAGALLGTALGPLPALRPPSLGWAAAVDAIDDIPNPTTRAEVMDALRDYCGLRPDAGICAKIAGR